MVQTRPHPCVIGYSAWNEGGQAEFTDRVVALMQSLDSTRPLSRACGGGDWDIHIYTDMPSSLTRLNAALDRPHVRLRQRDWLLRASQRAEKCTRFSDPICFPSIRPTTIGRVSAITGMYAARSTWTRRGRSTGRRRKCVKYVLAKQPATERHLYLYVKSAFENFRGQRFAPSTALLYCRFDDPVPSSQLGLVAFNGHPRKAYFAAKESMQTVLPILFFGMTGPEDVRVINDYWHKSWKGCTLKYTLKNRDGSTVKQIERKFDLPEDSTVKVLTREEVGDIWRMPGFFAELQVATADGAVFRKTTTI